MSASGTGRTVKALVLAAGVGSRLRPLTDTMPKCLVPVAGRPLLDYWLEALARIGVRDILVNTHAHAGQVRDHLRAAMARNSGLRLQEFHEPKLLGSAGTLAANRSFADDADEVLVVYADNFSVLDLRKMLAFHRERSAEFTMLVFHAENPRACGIADVDAAGRVTSFEEKPEHPKGALANAGLYLLSADAYREAADMCAFDLGFEVLPRFVGRMYAFSHTGYHRDVGTPESYARAQADAHRQLAPLGQTADGKRRAVFLDRDGTIIEHVHYLTRSEDVRLVHDCGASLRLLRDAGYCLVVVTNQAAIAKGLLDEDGLSAIHERLFELLAREEVAVDAVYYCPLAGSSKDRAVIEHPDRKPGPGMLQRGASELHLDLPRSYMVGDMLSDVLAGINAGCRASVLVEHAAALAEREADMPPAVVRAASLTDAADWILADGLLSASGPAWAGRGLIQTS